MIGDWETSIKLRLRVVWQRVRSTYNNFDQSMWQLKESFKLQVALVWQRTRNTCDNLDKSIQQSWQIRVSTWRNPCNNLEKLWLQLGFDNVIGRLRSDLIPIKLEHSRFNQRLWLYYHGKAQNSLSFAAGSWIVLWIGRKKCLRFKLLNLGKSIQI